MEWSRIARQEVARVGATIPEGTPLKERKTLIDAGYPFGPRDYWPWKAWCKARRAYLEKHGLAPLHPKPMTLLDKLPRDPVTGRPVIQ